MSKTALWNIPINSLLTDSPTKVPYTISIEILQKYRSHRQRIGPYPSPPHYNNS